MCDVFIHLLLLLVDCSVFVPTDGINPHIKNNNYQITYIPNKSIRQTQTRINKNKNKTNCSCIRNLNQSLLVVHLPLSVNYDVLLDFTHFISYFNSNNNKKMCVLNTVYYERGEWTCRKIYENLFHEMGKPSAFFGIVVTLQWMSFTRSHFDLIGLHPSRMPVDFEYKKNIQFDKKHIDKIKKNISFFLFNFHNKKKRKQNNTFA